MFSDALLREFLLGKVTDEDRQRIETLFLTDAEMKERIFAAEQELIDDYLDGALTTENRDQFLLQYGQTSEQQQRLRIAQSIKEWAHTESSGSQTVPANSSSWGVLGAQLRSKRALFIPIALAAVLLIVAVVWLRDLSEQRNRRLAVEQELAQLNSPSGVREDPSRILFVYLSPVTVRNAEQAEIRSRSGIRIVELRLPWIQKDRYSSYQAEFRRVGGDESFTIRNLQAATDGTIRVRLPTHLLSRGQFQLRLSGVGAGGVDGDFEEYMFVVGD